MGDRKNKNLEGKWIRYKEGVSYSEISNLQNLFRKNTSWDTYISLGDIDSLYVYFTKDENGEYTKPRIKFDAYSKNNVIFCIGVIQGVGKDRMVEGSVVYALEEKLKELNLYDEYKKKIYDTKTLSEIEMKHKSGTELSREELLFLYGINYFIDCIGTTKNTLVREIREMRDTKADLAKMFHCERESVGTKEEDFANNQIKVYYGNLFDYKVEDLSKLESLVAIVGNAYFNYTTDAKYFPNLEYVYGDVRLDQLKDANGLKIKYIGGSVYFGNIEAYEQVRSLEYVDGSIQVYNFDKRAKDKGDGGFQKRK